MVYLNILYANWQCLGATDVIEAFHEIGAAVYEVEISDSSHVSIDWDFVVSLGAILENNKIDVIFSFNFFPTLSEACYRYGRKYLSWVYDSPSLKVYHPSIINECNYVFIFDQAVALELQQKGITTVFYSPLAVNVGRLAKLKQSELDRKHYQCEVGFVGSLYNDEHNLYERLEEKANDPYLIGYLEGIMEAQMKVYGYNFLKESLAPQILKKISDIMPVDIPEGAFTDKESIYADFFLCRRMAYLERTRILTQLAEDYQVYHYTTDATSCFGKVINRGKVDYYDEMPFAFRYAKINLNMTLRSIKTGIPLRAMDILGAGGFLLTNYQEDFLQHFEPDVDYVYYGSIEELKDKVSWYLKHDSERQKIAQNGRDRVEKNHTYVKTLTAMMKVVGLYD